MKKMLVLVVAAALLVLTGCAATAPEVPVTGACDQTDKHNLGIEIAVDHDMVVDLPAGNIQVVRRGSGRDIKVRGQACAPTAEGLEGVRLTSETLADGTVQVKAIMPAGKPKTTVHLAVELPARTGIKITNGDGEIRVQGVERNVEIHDGAGTIDVSDTKGNVVLVDTEGDVVVKSTGGNVMAQDGAGLLKATGTKGTMVVPQKGAGDIDADGVSGNLVVTSIGSGGKINHKGVKGLTILPNGMK